MQFDSWSRIVVQRNQTVQTSRSRSIRVRVSPAAVAVNCPPHRRHKSPFLDDLWGATYRSSPCSRRAIDIVVSLPLVVNHLRSRVFQVRLTLRNRLPRSMQFTRAKQTFLAWLHHSLSIRRLPHMVKRNTIVATRVGRLNYYAGGILAAVHPT